MGGIAEFVRTRIWAPLPKSATPAQCRTAAWLWGGALLALAAWGAWGHHSRQEPIGLRTWFWVVLAVSLAGSLLSPLGSRVYIGVLRFFSIFGFFISHVVLFIGYYLMVTPLALVMRLTGRDPLAMKPGQRPGWRAHSGKTDRRRYFRLS